MGISASLGYPDCQAIPLSEMTEAISRIVDKVNLPVTADIEGGYGKSMKEIVDSTQKIISTGIIGINIEDSYDLKPQLVEKLEFCERISAIRELSDSLGFHLVINARTDVFITSSGALKDRLSESIRRGNKYREAGADCVFIPNVWETDKISALVNEINAPINILSNPTSGTGFPPTIPELEKLGVARVSLGSSLMKATLAVTRKIANELKQERTYNILSETLTPISETLEAYRMAAGISK